MAENTYLEKTKDDAAEFLEIFKKVPESRKGEVMGILKGFALATELDRKGA